MYVIGTAGHVDHGKSTLVHALTGIDPDRLQEEKEREMTIDLGFAWLTLPGGEAVGVIDVPGHIDFIKNMLAGVGGIDAALFVVAADEGVMPQTREHLAILDLLEVPAGVVALTKMDAITEEGWLELVEADLQDTLVGTCLGKAPIVRVSARTGAGLESLKQALADVLAATPSRLDKSQPRLPIDRAFSVAGFGTVVTGTLSDGSLRVGDEVEIVPGGLRARVRGLQMHRKPLEMGLPGSRLAINLTGVHPDQLARGMVVARPGALRPTTLVDVRLRLVTGNSSLAAGSIGTLRSKPLSSRPERVGLSHNQTVDFFTGAAEVPAHIRLLDGEEIRPGSSGWAQLRLEAPVALVAGDHFIIRQASPSLTVGGGRVVNPYPRRRWRRFQPEVIAQLEALERGTPEDLLLHALAMAELSPLKSVIESSGLEPKVAEATLASMIETGQVLLLGSLAASNQMLVVGSNVRLKDSPLPAISIGGWHTLTARITQVLDEYHTAYPLRPGIPREELRSRLQWNRSSKWSAKLFNELVARAATEGLLEETGEYVHQPGRHIVLAPDQQARVDTLLKAFRRQPYAPPSMTDSTATVGNPEIISALLYQGLLIRLSEDVLLLKETYDEMVAQILAFINEHGSMTVAQVRDTFNTSRKYALAIMEHLDDRKVTRRVGDERVRR
jgi:selenocysteine-specific elongation factor